MGRGGDVLLSEQKIVDTLAGHAESITGVRRAYGFAKNPDNLNPAELPAILFHPPVFRCQPKGHNNFWQNEIMCRGVLFVAERQSRGGTLKYLENAAMPFGGLFRAKFQTQSVIQNLLGMGTGATVAWLEEGTYGAGGQYLTLNGIPYIGWVFTWRFVENT